MIINRKLFWPFASLLICAALYFIWPTVHTIALRKLLIVLGASIGVVLWVKSEDRLRILKSPWLIYLGLLFVWVVFHASFLSQNGKEAWGEFIGQWVPAYLAVLAGIGLAIASRSFKPSIFGFYFILVLSAQTVLYVLLSCFQAIKTGHFTVGFFGQNDIKMGTDLKLSLIMYANLLAAFSCAKLISSIKTCPKELKTYFWILPVALAFYVAFFSGALNGMMLIGACIMVTIIIIAYLFRARVSKRYLAATIILSVVFVSVAINSATVVNLWQRLVNNTKVAINIDENPHWLRAQFGHAGNDMPINEFGEILPESFYYRVARATAGMELIFEHPLGYGVTRKAFERLVQQEHPEASVAHAENGYINLVCAVGFPGLILFALVLISVFRQLRKSSSEWAHPAAWMIGIVALHWGLDAIDRDHFFEIYLFMIGLLATLTLNTDVNNKSNA